MRVAVNIFSIQGIQQVYTHICHDHQQSGMDCNTEAGLFINNPVQ